MAKTNNLTDFLTDVADAIRYKKGTTEKINPQNFSAEIVSIETGEGGPSTQITANDVTFYDYDGRVLYSYTKEEFIFLRNMPPLPIREGLVCQEWNYTLEDAQSYVADYGVCNIGATYITDDGKTRLYITIAAEGRMDVPLYFSQTVANGVTIDWGDGSATNTCSSAGTVNTTHHYESIGDYVISLEVADGCILKFEHRSVMGDLGVYCNMLRKAEVGHGVNSIGSYAFNTCHSLSSIVIPDGITSIGSNAFSTCYFLSSIVIPNGVTSIGNHAFNTCHSLSSIVIPNGVTSIGSYAFNTCHSLSSIVIPSGVTSINSHMFYECYSLSSIMMPNSVVSIGSYAFRKCTSLSSIVIPNGVTSIGSYAFNTCHSLSSIVIPDGVTSIESDTFEYCYSLSSIVIPNSVTGILTSAFDSCTSLSSIVIPNGITRILSNAFNDCVSMAFYDFSSCTAVPTLPGSIVFDSIPSDCKIIVPDTLYDEWVAATNWSTYASYIIKASDFKA